MRQPEFLLRLVASPVLRTVGVVARNETLASRQCFFVNVNGYFPTCRGAAGPSGGRWNRALCGLRHEHLWARCARVRPRRFITRKRSGKLACRSVARKRTFCVATSVSICHSRCPQPTRANPPQNAQIRRLRDFAVRTWNRSDGCGIVHDVPPVRVVDIRVGDTADRRAVDGRWTVRRSVAPSSRSCP